jgi:hypothetical protein
MLKYNPITMMLEDITTMSNDLMKKTRDARGNDMQYLMDKKSKVVLGKLLVGGHSMSLDDWLRQLNLKVDDEGEIIKNGYPTNAWYEDLITVGIDSPKLKGAKRVR